MFSIIPDLYAMTPQSGDNPGMMGQLVLFGSIFLIFFLLVIRPQQKKAKKHQAMVSEIKKGDQIITSSGIYGKVSKYYDDKDFMLLEIAEKIVIKVQKGQIADVVRSKPTKETPKLDSEK